MSKDMNLTTSLTINVGSTILIVGSHATHFLIDVIFTPYTLFQNYTF